MKTLSLTVALLASFVATSAVNAAPVTTTQQLSATDQQALKLLLDKMHPPVPAGLTYLGYDASATGPKALPQGCQQDSYHDPVLKRTFVRVVCGDPQPYPQPYAVPRS